MHDFASMACNIDLPSAFPQLFTIFPGRKRRRVCMPGPCIIVCMQMWIMCTGLSINQNNNCIYWVLHKWKQIGNWLRRYLRKKKFLCIPDSWWGILTWNLLPNKPAGNRMYNLLFLRVCLISWSRTKQCVTWINDKYCVLIFLKSCTLLKF